MMFLSGASTINSAVTQHQQAGAVLAQGQYAKRIADFNANLDEQQAADAITRGATAEHQSRVATKQIIGAQRASYAAQGIDANIDTASDIQAETAGLGELDALTIRNNAAREAYGYDVRASNSRMQGVMDMTTARGEASSLNASAWNTLLTGTANTYNMYSKSKPSKKGGSKSTPKGTMVPYSGGPNS